MKLLVTGGLGFIGSNFILKLLEKHDIEITNVDAELYGSDHRNLSQITNSDKYNFVKGNISNKKLMEEQIEKCDAVVNFVVGRYLYERYPDQDEGFMTRIRSKLVRSQALAEFATNLGLDKYLLISKHVEDRCGGRKGQRILEDVFESFILLILFIIDLISSA